LRQEIEALRNAARDLAQGKIAEFMDSVSFNDALKPFDPAANAKYTSLEIQSAPLVDRASIKIGVTNGYICLALPKQIWVISNPPAASRYPCHFRFVGRAANRHTKRYAG
jgi:hypothetical protein